MRGAIAKQADVQEGPAGMPVLDLEDKPLSYFEFWPAWLFYLPAFAANLFYMLYFRGLTLPTAANPAFSGGGLVGESKKQILSYARQSLGDLVAPFAVHRHRIGQSDLAAQALEEMKTAGITFPIVAKPDVSCRGAGVQPLYSIPDLKRYLGQLSTDADIILQKLVNCEGEAGVFYVREPGQAQGKIISLTLKYFPYVTGDGKSTVKELIERDPRASALTRIYFSRFHDRLTTIPNKGQRLRLAFAGNHSKGTIFRDGTHLVTPEMTATFDRMSQKIFGFFFGRYDIRFDDLRDLQNGTDDFTILEINGAGAELTHIWDARTPLRRAWADITRQFFWVWRIGALNRQRGHRPLRVRDLWAAYRREKELTPHYPPTL